MLLSHQAHYLHINPKSTALQAVIFQGPKQQSNGMPLPLATREIAPGQEVRHDSDWDLCLRERISPCRALPHSLPIRLLTAVSYLIVYQPKMLVILEYSSTKCDKNFLTGGFKTLRAHWDKNSRKIIHFKMLISSSYCRRWEKQSTAEMCRAKSYD